MTTKPCARCGVDKQLSDFYKTKDGRLGCMARCKICVGEQAAEKHSANPQLRAEINARYRRNNPEKVREYAAANSVQAVARVTAWRLKNPDKFAAQAPRRNARTDRWRKKNPDKIKAWSDKNKASLRAAVAKRRFKRRRATPSWANAEKIKSFYHSADMLNMLTGEWHHVDHIVPLQSRIVCGLHNEFNLQILPAKKNIAKGNRHWPDMP